MLYPRRVIWVLLVTILALGVGPQAFAGGNVEGVNLPTDYRGVHYAIEAEFADVKDEIILALTERGNVINNTSHISDMLQRTGKDTGAQQQVYVQAEALEFCSATLSRNMLAIDPHSIIYCPYIIAIYVVPQQPSIVHVAFRQFDQVADKAARQSLVDVEHFLREIIQQALDNL